MKAKIALICCALLIIVGAAYARMTVIGVAGVESGEEPGGPEIENVLDNCTTGWTVLTGGITCSSGSVTGTNNWNDNRALYATALTSGSHYISATIQKVTSPPDLVDYSGLIIGSTNNASAFYWLRFSGTTIQILASNGQWSGSYDGSYGDDTYDVVLQIDTSGEDPTFKLWVDSTEITASLSSATDAISGITPGNYIGLILYRSAGGTNVSASNLTASSGEYTP